MSWHSVLELDSRRNVTGGSVEALSAAIGRAGDLRIYTEFRHNEHIDVTSRSCERLQEVAEFGVTYRLENQWAAGIMSLRQPIELPHGFGPRPSMSFFLYNQDGSQAIARPHLDGVQPEQASRRSPEREPIPEMPKYHLLDSADVDTNAPSRNFVYDFDVFRYCVSDAWREVLSHSASGDVISGSIQDLVDAFARGSAIKLGLRNLWTESGDDAALVPDHEVFVQGGSAYYYTEQRLFIIGSHPVVRVRPHIPMRYRSHGWDFGWLMLRTDGKAVYRRCDPYTLKFTDQNLNLAIRWFVRS